MNSEEFSKALQNKSFDADAALAENPGLWTELIQPRLKDLRAWTWRRRYGGFSFFESARLSESRVVSRLLQIAGNPKEHVVPRTMAIKALSAPGIRNKELGVKVRGELCSRKFFLNSEIAMETLLTIRYLDSGENCVFDEFLFHVAYRSTLAGSAIVENSSLAESTQSLHDTVLQSLRSDRRDDELSALCRVVYTFPKLAYPARDRLFELLRKPQACGNACLGISKLTHIPPEVVDTVRSLRKTPRGATKYQLWSVLCRFDDASVEDCRSLVQLLKHRNAFVRDACIKQLVSLGRDRECAQHVLRFIRQAILKQCKVDCPEDLHFFRRGKKESYIGVLRGLAEHSLAHATLVAKYLAQGLRGKNWAFSVFSTYGFAVLGSNNRIFNQLALEALQSNNESGEDFVFFAILCEQMAQAGVHIESISSLIESKLNLLCSQSFLSKELKGLKDRADVALPRGTAVLRLLFEAQFKLTRNPTKYFETCIETLTSLGKLGHTNYPLEAGVLQFLRKYVRRHPEQFVSVADHLRVFLSHQKVDYRLRTVRFFAALLRHDAFPSWNEIIQGELQLALLTERHTDVARKITEALGMK